MRAAFVLVISSLGLACTGREPPPSEELEEVVMTSRSAHELPEQPKPEPTCPAGTTRRERGGEGPDAFAWWCARGEVPHGPFLDQDFDERSRTWYEIRGEHVDGQRHGLVESEGFYEVEHSGRSRVFLREWLDHGRVVRSNEASVRIALDATAPVATRRFVVKAMGLAPSAEWADEPAAIGAFDLEVWSTWVDAPASASPSVLRVELSAPATSAPLRADALLHPLADTDPPTTASGLPHGYVPTVTATWRDCKPAGCELELAVTLRWLAPGPGRLEAHVTARAVPDTWPEAASIEVTASETSPRTPMHASEREAIAKPG